MKKLNTIFLFFAVIHITATNSWGQCSVDEYTTEDGRQIVQAKMEQLFLEVGDRQNGYYKLGYTMVAGRLYKMGNSIYLEIAVGVESRGTVVPRELDIHFDNFTKLKIKAMTYEARGPLQVCTFEITNEIIQQLGFLGVTSILIFDNRTLNKTNAVLTYKHLFSDQYKCITQN